ncbi:MAG: hypothetical protein E7411_02045 [Ruminococcaceae bacterium]|nr:hypothetical protein [Oscillospiraceae bacterium]
MIKKILAFTLSLNIILAGVTAFAVPSARYVFYDNDEGELFIFGQYDKKDSGAEDVGIFVNGEQFSYAKDGDTENLDKQNKEATPKFAIGLKAPRNSLGKVDIYPYAKYSDGFFMTGDTVSYDTVKGIITSPKSLLFENFTGYQEGLTMGSDNRFPDNQNIITRVYSDTQNVSVVKTEIVNHREKNILKISDTSNRYGSALEIIVPQYERILTFEIRFKLNKTTTEGFAFNMGFYGDTARTKQAFSIEKSSGADSGLYYVNSGGNTIFTGGVNMNDEWFTMKVRMDTLLEQTAISIENDGFSKDVSESINRYNYLWQDMINKKVIAYNQSWYNEYECGNIKKIYISTGSGTCGDYYIDYIKLGEGGEEIYPVRTRAKSQPYKTIPDPTPRY